MHNEKVFTPSNIVNLMLDMGDYNKYHDIREKFAIDNSCGDGAFLVEMANRYIDKCIEDGDTIEDAYKEFRFYVHGYEIDEELCNRTKERLTEIFRSRGYKGECSFDRIICTDTLRIDYSKGLYDFVFANPPYCRIQHLAEQYDIVKNIPFCKDGNTDLYMAFYYIGIDMASINGKVVYITPNSWLNGKLGRPLREYLAETKELTFVLQLGSEKVFDASTYTAITRIDKDKSNGLFHFRLGMDEPWITGKLQLSLPKKGHDPMYLASFNDMEWFNKIRFKKKCEYDIFSVKNGFATLNDQMFLFDEYNVEENAEDVIRVVKSSTAQEHRMIYPYDRQSKLKDFESLSETAKEKLLTFAKDNNIDTTKENWHQYGRTQALKDVWVKQLAVTSLIKTTKDVKTELAVEGEGVYGGLYVVSDDDRCLPLVEIFMKHPDFIRYVKILGHHKANGYYTFNSEELKQYLNYKYKEWVRIPKKILVVARQEDGGIGYQNKLLYKLKGDMQHFYQLTKGGVVIMGKKTFDSMGGHLLKERLNIILTTNKAMVNSIYSDKVYFAHDMEEAIEEAERYAIEKDTNIFIIGGSSVYNQALSKDIVDEMYITTIYGNKESDTKFQYDEDKWKVLASSKYKEDDVQYKIERLIRSNGHTTKGTVEGSAGSVE